MATLISAATGNFTTASTWKTASAVANAELDSNVSSIVITGSSANNDLSTFVPAATGIDAIALKFNQILAPTGTFTVILRNSTAGTDAATVTVNASDLMAQPLGAGNFWYVFSFATVTPNGTDTYFVRIRRSVADNAGNRFALSASTASILNASRMIRLTTTAAPAAGDKLVIAGELTGAGTNNNYTVTMNNTATTSFGPTVSGGPPEGMTINDYSTLSYGTAASTNYYLRIKGILGVASGGTLNIGTSGTPIPSTSTAVLEFDPVANVDSGLVVGGLGTFNAYGTTKTNFRTEMTADKAAAATVIAVGSTSGWAAGDELAFASTTRTASDCEKKTILTVDSATQVTLTAGLTSAHSGTVPTRAEVLNLTRNVKIRGTSTTLQGYILTQSTSVVTLRYVEFLQLGTNSSPKRGIEALPTTGSFDIQYCSVHDSGSTGSGIAFNTSITNGNNFTCSNNALYNIPDRGIWVANVTTGTNWVIDNCVVIRTTVGNAIEFLDVGGTATNLTAVGAQGSGISIAENATIGTFNNLTAHSNNVSGIGFANVGPNSGTISNLTAWRNNTASTTGGGIAIGSANSGLAGPKNLTLDTIVSFGNNCQLNLFANCFMVNIRNFTLNGDTTFASTNGIALSNGGQGYTEIFFENGDMGTASGILTTCGTDLVFNFANTPCRLVFHNTKFSSATEVGSQTNMAVGSSARSQRHDQTAALHRSWFVYGTIDIDTTTFRTASPSEKLTPNNASSKLESGAKRAAVASGSTLTPTVYVNKSASYNGNQPRLLVRRNVAAGITADTVLATASGGTASWLTLTGTTAAVTDDAVLEFYVDCDGTAGTVSIDDWSVA
jgi:hypothetical protein